MAALSFVLDEIYKASLVPLQEKRRLGFKAVGMALLPGNQPQTEAECSTCAAKERYEEALAAAGEGLGLPEKPNVQEVKKHLRSTSQGIRLAARLGKASKIRNQAAHPDVALVSDIAKHFDEAKQQKQKKDEEEKKEAEQEAETKKKGYQKKHTKEAEQKSVSGCGSIPEVEGRSPSTPRLKVTTAACTQATPPLWPREALLQQASKAIEYNGTTIKGVDDKFVKARLKITAETMADVHRLILHER